MAQANININPYMGIAQRSCSWLESPHITFMPCCTEFSNITCTGLQSVFNYNADEQSNLFVHFDAVTGQCQLRRTHQALKPFVLLVSPQSALAVLVALNSGIPKVQSPKNHIVVPTGLRI